MIMMIIKMMIEMTANNDHDNDNFDEIILHLNFLIITTTLLLPVLHLNFFCEMLPSSPLL